jgi:hypothetical protein
VHPIDNDKLAGLITSMPILALPFGGTVFSQRRLGG